MATVTCAISGITYKVPHVPMVLDSTFIAHPIFYLPTKDLEELYLRYLKNQLNEIDSYLLYLALVHSTDCVSWESPLAENPKDSRVVQVIASSIEELTRVIWMTGEIRHPAFKQPHYVFRARNKGIAGLKNWIVAWRENIERFKLGIAIQEEIESLVRVENRLSTLVHSGIQDVTLASSVAEWACKAACFPALKAREYKEVIRKCFTPEKIFRVDTALIKEIKHFCEDNIESSSIHFHTLMETLRAGYKNNLNYLGIVDLEGFITDKPVEYVLFSRAEKEEKEKELGMLEKTISTAPTAMPVAGEYCCKADYIQAKLKFMTARAYSSKR